MENFLFAENHKFKTHVRNQNSITFFFVIFTLLLFDMEFAFPQIKEMN